MTSYAFKAHLDVLNTILNFGDDVEVKVALKDMDLVAVTRGM